MLWLFFLSQWTKIQHCASLILISRRGEESDFYEVLWQTFDCFSPCTDIYMWTSLKANKNGCCKRGETQAIYKNLQISTNFNSSPFFHSISLQAEEYIEQCLWFSREKRAKVNRKKKSFIVLLILRREKRLRIIK